MTADPEPPKAGILPPRPRRMMSGVRPTLAPIRGATTAHGGAKWWPGTVRKVTMRTSDACGGRKRFYIQPASTAPSLDPTE